MVQPIQFQGMPLQNTPIIDRNGCVTPTWYRFFQSLFDRSGLGTSEIGIRSTPLQSGGKPFLLPVFLAKDPTASGTPVVSMFDQTTGQFIGIFVYTP